MSSTMLQIAIDGPAGAGKSTVARAVARELDILYLDTGAMYRALGLRALREGVSPDDEAAVTAMLERTSVTVEYTGGEQRTLLDGEDVSGAIRTNEVSAAASAVSRWKAVRLKMVELQRQIAASQPTVLDGREIGTFVLPQAPYKIYLTATVAERARRRHLEQLARGIDVPLEQYEQQIAARDRQDMEREFAPLRQPEDAVYLDSTGLKPEEVIRRIVNLVRFGDRADEKSPGQRACYRFMRYAALPIFRLVIRPRMVGCDVDRLKGPFLVCVNHTSALDAPVLAGALLPRKCSFMGKSSLFEKKIVAWFVAALGGVAVHRGEADTAAVKKALSILDQGRMYVIFPEGTRNLKQDGSIAPFHPGVGLIALKAKVPVLPIYIANGGKYTPFRPFEIRVGEPISLADMAGKRVNNSAVEACTARIYAVLEELRKNVQKD